MPPRTYMLLGSSTRAVPFIKVMRRYLPAVLIMLLLVVLLLCLNAFVLHRQPDDQDDSNDFYTVECGRPLQLPSGDDPNATVRAQREFVRDMMRHAWSGYETHAWGYNVLRPISRTGGSQGIFGAYRLGATIVDSLDTLYIMNMRAEFKRARDWVDKTFVLTGVDDEVSVFETNIRFTAGLLSAYAFTRDQMFLQKARHVANKLLPAFNTGTGIPYTLINPKTGKTRNFGVFAYFTGGYSSLAGLGSHHLEFVYLSAATGDPKYARKVKRIRDTMDGIGKGNGGLYNIYVNPHSGSNSGDVVSVGAQGDSFYEYLIKSWILSNRTDSQSRRMFDTSADAIDKHLIRKSKSGLTYLPRKVNGHLGNSMTHLTCFAGGMFALGSVGVADQRVKDFYLTLGAQLTDTCAESYKRTATKIGPEEFYFTDSSEAVAIDDKQYLLRPEVIESYFYLWRLTHDQRFRDYAWSAAQAIGRHCRTSVGFADLVDTSDPYSAKYDTMETFLLAETLKYLYLIFSSDDLLPLSDWVFNTEAHPFPVLSPHQLKMAGLT